MPKAAPKGAGSSRRAPLIFQAWKAKLACSAGVLGYYLVGYFALNRFAFERYHELPRTPFFDDLPLIPWTVVVYNSVFVLGTLAIWLLQDSRALKRYFATVCAAYTIDYVIFATFPTRIDRAPVPEGSMWGWAFDLMRTLDAPHTCFPSLHITNCVLGVIAFWGTRRGTAFLAWTVAIALSTLTTDQHLFVDLPAGAAAALAGSAVARKLLPSLWRASLPGRAS